MSNTDKVIAVFKEAAKLLPGQVGAALLELVSPANLAITAGVLVAFGVGQALGYGLIVDIILIGGGILVAGQGAIEGVKLLAQAVARTTSATKQSDIQVAGQLLAQAVLKLGVATIVALLTKRAVVKLSAAGTASAASAVPSRYMTYNETLEAVESSPFRGKFDVHHLWEKRFAWLIHVAEGDIISAPVLPRYHRAVNGVLKPKGRPFGVPYGVIDSNIDQMIVNILKQRFKVTPKEANLQQVWIAHREVYLRLGQGNWADAIYELYVKPHASYW